MQFKETGWNFSKFNHKKGSEAGLTETLKESMHACLMLHGQLGRCCQSADANSPAARCVSWSNVKSAEAPGMTCAFMALSPASDVIIEAAIGSAAAYLAIAAFDGAKMVPVKRSIPARLSVCKEDPEGESGQRRGAGIGPGGRGMVEGASS
eukprot:scaffold220735_cov19-Tisochrysis_lutea.AAC.2